MVARLAIGLVALLLALPAGASRVVHVQRSPIGTTITMALDHAPFPAPGHSWKDNTVIVFVPWYFRAPLRRRLDIVVFFHGHGHTAAAAMTGQQLREQVVDSKQNVVLVIPQGPVRARSSAGGKLDKPGGLRRLLEDVRRTLQSRKVTRSLGRRGIPRGARVGRVALAAHSGGFAVVARSLEHGGVEVSEVYLFDALYGHLGAYRDWVTGRRTRKLVSFFARGRPAANNRTLMGMVRKAKVPVLLEEHEGKLSRRQLVRGRAIFIGAGVDHGSVPFRHNGLRDCLYASGFKRHLRSRWFKNSRQPRKIDKRSKP